MKKKSRKWKNCRKARNNRQAKQKCDKLEKRLREEYKGDS